MVTCVDLRPFDHEIFNSLPSIEACDEAFRENNGVDFVDNYAKSLLIKHNLEHVFGFGLLHRHFALRKNEKLVEHNNVSIPWKDVPEPSSEEHNDISVLPDALMMTPDGNLMPYEYCYNPMSKKVCVDFELKKIQSFLAEFAESVKEAGLEPYLGLRRYHKGFFGGLERTEGRANIMFPTGQYPESHLQNSIETMWFFPRIEQMQADGSVSMVAQATTVKAECQWYGGECKNQGAPTQKENVHITSKTGSLAAATQIGPGQILKQGAPFASLPSEPVTARCAARCYRRYENGKHWHAYDPHVNSSVGLANPYAESAESCGVNAGGGGHTKHVSEAPVNSTCSGYCAKNDSDHGICHTITYNPDKLKTNAKMVPVTSIVGEVQANLSKLRPAAPINSKCTGYCANDGERHGSCHTTTYDSEADKFDMDLVKKAQGSA